MLLKHPLKGLKGKGASRSTFHNFYLQKDPRFSAFCFGPSARCFLEKLSLISLLKSDLKIHVFAFLTLSNKNLAFFKKKKTWCPFSHVIERKRCPFLTLFRFGGSRGGGLSERRLAPLGPPGSRRPPASGSGAGEEREPANPAETGWSWAGAPRGGPGVQPRDPRQILPRFLDIKRPFVAQKGSWRPSAF